MALAAARHFALDQHKSLRADAVELLLRSVCRLSNIFQADRANIGSDGLLLPVTKNGSPFMLPLTPDMRALIGETGAGLIFPGDLTCKKRLIEDLRRTMNDIARSGGFNGDFTREFFKDGTRNPHHWSAHDFRATAMMWFKSQRDPATGIARSRSMCAKRYSTIAPVQLRRDTTTAMPPTLTGNTRRAVTQSKNGTGISTT